MAFASFYVPYIFYSATSIGHVHSLFIQMWLLTGSKDNLLKMFKERSVIQFAEFYPAGHKQTNYKKWFSSDTPYPIK